MLDKLPLNIRETIFSRVRYMDLFETARVSQGWWKQTMASFERFHHKKDDFLLDQVDFCNQMMAKEETWEWWMLMQFTKSKRLYLEISDFHALVSDGKGRLIQYFSSNEIHVKHLRVDIDEDASNAEALRLPSKLDEIFPFLTSLEVEGVDPDSHSTIVLTLNLISLRFGFGLMPPLTSSINMTTSELKVLDLMGCGFASFYLLNGLKFHQLTRLSVSAYGHDLSPFSSTEIEHILRSFLQETKTLKSVSIYYASITKNWLQIFPSNVVKIELHKPRLNQALVKAFGNNVFYERLLLMYVCEDWASVVQFKTWSMSWEEYQEEEIEDEEVDDEEEADEEEVNDDEEEVDEEGEVDEEEVDDDEGNNEGGGDNGIENAYQVNYTCRPTANEEAILVKYSIVAINELISNNNQGLLLTELSYYNHSFAVPIPANVRNLRIFHVWYNPDSENFELVLEDPTTLQTLIGCFRGRKANLPTMINLRKLDIFDCNKKVLVSILRSNTSLSKLTLNSPKEPVFKNISSDIKSVSLKSLTIVYGSGTFESILKHFPSLSSLILENHCRESILKSDIRAIKRLQYFKMFMEPSRKVSKEVDKEVALHLSSLQFPYMMFACYRGAHYCAASKGLELVNEISRKTTRHNIVKARRSSFVLCTKNVGVSHSGVSLVYAKNIPTRFMRNTCHLVSTVQDYIAKLQSTEYN